MSSGPGIIVHAPGTRQSSHNNNNISRRRRSSRRRSSAVHLPGGPGATNPANGLESIDVERLSYINTALEAVPGITLRRFFAPVMRVRSRLMARDRASKRRMASYGGSGGKDVTSGKARKEAVNQLCTALNAAAAGILLDAPLNLDLNALLELLAEKMEPVSYRADDVLSLPCEPAEASFVYIVINGSVRVTHFQQHARRTLPSSAPALATATPSRGADRKQFFTSSDEVFRLFTTGGICAGFDGGSSGEGLGIGETGTVIAGNAVSVSNMTTAIQRSLRKASRAVGQPTLQPLRTEVLRAPFVLGAAEALGLAPGRCATCTATATAMPVGPGKAAGNNQNGHSDGNDASGMQYVEYTDVVRVRVLDVHAALVELARRDMEARGGVGEWLSAPAGALPTRGVARTVGDFVAAARARVLASAFPQNEVLMRQSWLLQDTPPATLRNLISRLTPRTYMPGDVIACPHMNSSAARQLCFLRRGRLLITEAPSPDGAAGTIASPVGHATSTGVGGRFGRTGRACDRCGGTPFLNVLEVVHAGSSFGELSILFGEARGYTLVADSVCDVWCLPHADFAQTMRRDDTLRTTLVDKAASLRIKWLAEQRFTPALAAHLRTHSQIFRPFCDVVLRLIQERVEPVVYSPGQLITSTSERCEELIFIMHGTVESICEGVAAYGPGDVLGEGCLVAHRWPLGLAARTMVEGWRLSRGRLVDALERADRLHEHSGEVTSLAPLLMKKIFQPPVPEVESDVVGRLRMPVVESAPAGLRYTAFARRVAEVQLKALCFTYRDYVKWEDINYATMGSGEGSRETAAIDAAARDWAIATMRGEAAPALPIASTDNSANRKGRSDGSRPGTASQQQQQHHRSIADAVAAVPDPATQPPRRSTLAVGQGPQSNTADASVAAGAAAGSGRAAAARISHERRAASARPPGGRKPRADGSGTSSSRRRNNTGACAFLVNPVAMDAPFTRRLPGSKRPTSSSARAASECLALQLQLPPSTSPSPALRKAHEMPPRLRALTRTLGERDRVLAGEVREEAEMEKKLAAQQQATVREHLVASSPPSLPAAAGGEGKATPPPQQSALPGTVVGAVQAAALLDAGGQRQATIAAPILVSDPVPLSDPLPPVHIFLSADHPRFEITMAEALSIGYVMQLPDSHSIQSCVSFVDPDVTVGPPPQRGRRHAMATTPNDRYHKHNFLFAAAVFENISKLEEQLQDLREEERCRTAKSQKLMAMLLANTSSSRWHAERNGGGNETYQQDVLTSPGADGVVESPSQERSGSRRRSPSAGATTSPMRVGRVLATPSPFRGSPGKGSVKGAEAFERMLKRGDPAKAMDMLRAKYQLAPAPARGAPSSTQPQLALSTSQESGPHASTAGVSESMATTAVPGRAPSLLDRMRDAAGASTGSDSNDDGVVMTNAAAAAPELPIANYRDRHHAQQSYLSTVARQFAGELAGAKDGGSSGSPLSLSTSALLLGAAQSTTLEAHLTQRKDSVLFVDGYGALGVSPEAQAAGSVVLAPAKRDSARGGSPSEDGDAAAAAAGAEGEGEGEREGGRLRRQRTLSRSATTTFVSNGSAGAEAHMFGGSLTPVDFVMPDIDDANAMMRRIQRDIEGLNAVAKEQTRERRAAREKERQLGVKHVRAAAAALAQPTAEEQQVLEDWQRASRLLSRDPVAAMIVPSALRPQAGPDYLRRGVKEVNQAVAAEAARDAAALGVAAWQEEQLVSSAAGGATTPARTPGGARLLATPGGGYSGGTAAAALTATDDPSAAKRTIAGIGTSQLGYRATPLVTPSQAMDRSEYQRYQQDREAFFESYKRNPNALLTGDLVEPQLPQNFETVSRATTAAAAVAAHAQQQHGGKEDEVQQQQQRHHVLHPRPPPPEHEATTEDERRFVPWM